MVRINTSQQKVDEKKYADGYDRIFGKDKYSIPVLDDPVEPMQTESIWGTILLGVFSGLVVGFFICALIWLGLQ